MRLQQKEIKIIKDMIYQFFKGAKVYIYGSRLDNTKRGGDIDIFIIPSCKVENIRVKRAKLKLFLEERLLKPVDILIHQDFKRKIEQEALKGEMI